MATQYSSKVFTGIEEMNKSVEERLNNLSDKAKSITEPKEGPVKDYVESLKQALTDFSRANRELLDQSQTAGKQAVESLKDELVKTRNDVQKAVEKTRDEMIANREKGVNKLEQSLQVVKNAVDEVKSTFSGEKPSASDKKQARPKKIAKKPASNKKTADQAA